jgi:putative spermidine/putrescine transport system ATP-binding protein
MLFQNYALFPHMSVAESVAFWLEMRGIRRRAAAARIEEVLRLVGLNGFERRLPAALSGGQQQRIALARALVVEPALLLLDEPQTALDKNLREGTQVELRGLDQFREPECATSAKLPTCGPACTRAARASLS